VLFSAARVSRINLIFLLPVMGLLVNGAIGALSAVVGSLAAVSFVGSKLAPAGAILFGLIGFFAAGQIFAVPAAVPVAASRKQRGGAASADVEFDDEVSTALPIHSCAQCKANSQRC
jgi:hypothetical protein